MADLRAYISGSGDAVRERLVNGVGGGFGKAETLRRLNAIVDVRGGAFFMPADDALYEATLLSAALPSDDYPLFTFATALLLLDRIQNGSGADNLYWNWESFRRDYELADPPIRAAILNGYRFGALAGAISIPDRPNQMLCQTRSREGVLAVLNEADRAIYALLLRAETSVKEAGAAWAGAGLDREDPAVISVFRYLYERPESMEPPISESVPLIPWSSG